jgi:SAM-dependent methyltransferase
MKQTIPWWLKIAAKLVLSRLPVPYRLWKRLGLFVHGSMDQPGYTSGVFLGHLSAAGLDGRNGFTCLEIGPGDSLCSAMIAKAKGSARCWLVDTGDFAARDMEVYRAMARHIEALGLQPPPASALTSLETMLAYCDATYLTGGVSSLRAVPDGSVDLVWSQATLEHIRRRDFNALLRETRRILKPGGACSHTIDLQDHLGGALNNLRFPEWLWEADWFACSGFYTNRIGFSDMMARFKAAGFAANLYGRQDFPALPTKRTKLARPFRDLPENELRAAGFSVVLR